MHQILISAGAPPQTPLGELTLTALPITLSWTWAPLLRRGEGKGWDVRGGEETRKGGQSDPTNIFNRLTPMDVEVSIPTQSHPYVMWPTTLLLFTARCTLGLVQSAVLRSHVVCPSVCPSVCDVGGL